MLKISTFATMDLKHFSICFRLSGLSTNQHIVDNPDNLKLIPVEYSEEHSEPFEVMVDAKFYSYVEYWAGYNIGNLLEQAFEVGVNALREIGA